MKQLALLLVALIANVSLAAQHFNVLVYHHVAEDTPASTSVTPKTFREHLEFFKANNYPVISLESALSAIENNEPLAENSIVITFDDAFRNIYTNAFPMLQEFDYPFTIFAATDSIDDGYGDMVTWDQLREMKKAGVAIANHSRDHGYLVRQRSYNDAWLNDMRANIEWTQSRLEEELGEDIPKWFAYPYGEFNGQLQGLLDDMGYIAFGQHSGGVWSGSDFQALPRFPAAGIYANTTTLKTKIESRPMPVDESTLSDMLVTQNPPTLVVNLTSTEDMNKNLNCFIDGNWKDASWRDSDTFSLTSDSALNEGRHRFNCTSKSLTGSYYYWFSKPWLVYNAD